MTLCSICSICGTDSTYCMYSKYSLFSVHTYGRFKLGRARLRADVQYVQYCTCTVQYSTVLYQSMCQTGSAADA